jgi:hypothetical protein
VDPLAVSYPWNSTFAFAENDVIRAIDLEGLERYVVVTIGSDVKYRGENFVKVFKDVEVVHISAEEKVTPRLISELSRISQSDPNGIGFLAIFSHGAGTSFFANSEEGGYKNRFTYDDLKTSFSGIKFTEGGQIYMGGCNLGRDLVQFRDANDNIVKISSFAQKMADVTNTTVIAADDKVAPKDESTFTYQPAHPKTNSFFKFNNGQTQDNIGSSVSVSQEFTFTKRRLENINLKPLEPIKITSIPVPSSNNNTIIQQ